MRQGLEKYSELKQIARSIILFHLQRIEVMLRDSNGPVTLEESLSGLMQKVVNFKITLWSFHPHFKVSVKDSEAFQGKTTHFLKEACNVSREAVSIEDGCGSLQDLKNCVDCILNVLSLVCDNLPEASFDDVLFKRIVLEDKSYLQKMSSVVGTVAGLSTLSKQTVQQFMVLFFKLMKKKATRKEIDCSVTPILPYLAPSVSPVDVRQFSLLGQCVNKRSRSGAATTVIVKKVGGEVGAEGVTNGKREVDRQILSYQ